MCVGEQSVVCLHVRVWYACMHMCRVGQNRIYIPYMTIYLVISLPKIPYIHRPKCASMCMYSACLVVAQTQRSSYAITYNVCWQYYLSMMNNINKDVRNDT